MVERANVQPAEVTIRGIAIGRAVENRTPGLRASSMPPLRAFLAQFDAAIDFRARRTLALPASSASCCRSTAVSTLSPAWPSRRHVQRDLSSSAPYHRGVADRSISALTDLVDLAGFMRAGRRRGSRVHRQSSSVPVRLATRNALAAGALEAHARRVAFGVEHNHVGDVNTDPPLDDPAELSARSARARCSCFCCCAPRA